MLTLFTLCPWAPEARRETLGEGGARREELRLARLARLARLSAMPPDRFWSVDEDKAICSSCLETSSEGIVLVLALAVPFVVTFALVAGEGDEVFVTAAAEAGVVATGAGALVFALFSPLSRCCFFFEVWIGSLFAYSCAPGIGGGMNEDDGDGKGEELGGESSDSERWGRSARADN